MADDGSNELHCKHFVVRKKRYCRMTVKKGQEYCGEHQTAESNGNESKDTLLRVVCPLNNKHTCYANKLAKHLKICNARQTPQPNYILKGVNCGDEDSSLPPAGTSTHLVHDKSQTDGTSNETDNSTQTRLLSNVTTKQIKEVVEKVKKVYEEHLAGKITENISKHPLVEKELNKSEYGPKTKKHLLQASSILGLLEESDLLRPETLYIEFGAGKGQLSFWLSKATEEMEKTSVLLVERTSHRHKQDNKLDKSEGKASRIRADIADLILSKVEAVETTKSVVGVTKHLCGDATDLAIRCLSKLQEDNGKVAGCLMAFCCHHRCRWTSYTGKRFFNNVGLTLSDFDIMCGMVSWATCGTGKGRESDLEPKDIKLNTRDEEIGLNREEKEQVGKFCKYVLNWGRLEYLQEKGFSSKLNFYINEDISPENLCIVAVKQ